jgi:hypothetical protein
MYTIKKILFFTSEKTGLKVGLSTFSCIMNRMQESVMTQRYEKIFGICGTVEVLLNNPSE